MRGIDLFDMPTEFIIQDASLKYINAHNIIEEGLLYQLKAPESGSAVETPSGSAETASIVPSTASLDGWTRKLELATKFPDSSSAIEVATRLHAEAPVRVMLLNTNGNQIHVNQIKFP